MDAALLTAGITAALAAAGQYAASSSSSGTRSRGASARKNQSRGARSVGITGMTPTKRSDVLVVPPSQTNVPQKIPRSIPGVIAWDSVKVDSLLTSSSTGIVETNFAFTLSQHPQASSWASLYDQYCIVQATVVFDSALAPGSTATPPRLFTALDFDNNTSLGSISALEDFATSEVINMEPGVKHMRSIRPCNKGSVSGGSVAVPQRTWVDCGTTTVPHYCIRSIIGQTAVASLAISVTQVIVYAFRNQI